MWGDEGSEELGGKAALEDLGQRCDGVGVKGDGEGGMFTHLVFHGADGLVQRGDGEVDSTRANNLAKVGWVVVDGERNGSADDGRHRESDSPEVEPEGENE